MSTPVTLAIVLNLQAALQSISKAAGYFNDVKASSVVLDPEPLANAAATEVPKLVVGHRIEPIERSFKGSRPVSIQDRFRVVIEAVLDVAGGTDTARKLTGIAELVADVEKALFVDLQRGLDDAGNPRALYTYVMQATPYVGLANQNRCYVEIPVEILIQRAYGQP